MSRGGEWIASCSRSCGPCRMSDGSRVPTPHPAATYQRSITRATSSTFQFLGGAGRLEHLAIGRWHFSQGTDRSAVDGASMRHGSAHLRSALAPSRSCWSSSSSAAPPSPRPSLPPLLSSPPTPVGRRRRASFRMVTRRSTPAVRVPSSGRQPKLSMSYPTVQLWPI